MSGFRLVLSITVGTVRLGCFKRRLSNPNGGAPHHIIQRRKMVFVGCVAGSDAINLLPFHRDVMAEHLCEPLRLAISLELN